MQLNERLLELTTLFKSVIKRFRQEWAERMESDISITQFRMLRQLGLNGEQRVVDLADFLSVTPGAVTGMADRLIEKGLIVRTRSEEDRRVVRLGITPAGEKAVESMLAIQIETVASMFGNLPEEDLEQMQRIFRQLMANLDKKEQ
ncbi:MarR family winged helix-turn-helix transcriptional regulator [Gorillibacterium sp. sgz5001074]|uniref:MarR family winged helix-turn-helix transcriptional regulator n=1 Tax=Gorillibacterium sp. sgz5001074 TaxID=3446695 RepID=UPI003F6640AF